MTAKVVNVTARSLSHAAKRSKTPVFVTSLYSIAIRNDRAVSIALAPSGRKQPPEKKILSVPLKKIKNGISF
jgi:hypothetical protein